MAVLAVLRRELRALVALPQTYAVAAAFLVISGVFFVTFLVTSRLPDLERYYSDIASTLIVLAPIVAMRSLAEERRSGALDITLSWPVPRRALVVGKYLANLVFTWLLLAVAWLYISLLLGLGEVEVGKAAGGFAGILLLSAAFTALALAVSARASSPTAAAFLGFGLLLGLWMLQFGPRWLGDEHGSLGERVADLAPSTHLEAAGRGVLDAGDVLYFLTCVAIGLGLAVQGLDGHRAGIRPRVERRRKVTLAGLGVAAIAFVLVVPAVEAQVDLTPTRRFTVTRQTREIASRVHSPVRITGFVDPDSAQAVQLRALAREYRVAHIPVTLQVVDPDERPGLARSLGVSRYGQMLVELEGRRELVDDFEEISLTSALLRLSRGGPALACFTVGHGEPDLEDDGPGGYGAFGVFLRQLGYDTKPLALGAPGGEARLARCRVVITAPRVPYLPSEAGLLDGYLRAEGRLVVLADPDERALPQLNDLLRPWGAAIGAGIVRDRSALAGDPTSVVAFSYPSESPPVRGLKREGIPVVFVAPRPIERTVEVTDPNTVSAMVASSSKSRIDDGTEGPFILAAGIDASRIENGPEGAPAIIRTRIGVVGSPGVASNRLIELFGNRDLSTGLVQWVAQEDDVISASRALGGVRKIVLTQARRNHLVRSAIVFPALAALLPLPVAIVRLRRG